MFTRIVVLALAACVAADNRIIGGKETTIEEFPYQAALEMQYYGQTICGGTIISQWYILTAAQCGYRAYPQYVNIRVGSAKALKGGAWYQVSNIIQYPYYCPTTAEYDVAIVALARQLCFGPIIQPISLVPEGMEPQHGEMLTVSGWGYTSVDGTGGLSPVLRMVRLPSIKREMCAPLYAESMNQVVTSNMICAGGGVNKASYKGDTGGPLVNSKGQLVGIVSWGRPTEITGYPRVFTNIASPKIHQFIKYYIDISHG